MTVEINAAWPLTKEGKPDWETVFEADDSGLIPLLQQARTIKAVREMMLVIVQMLFSRKEDVTVRDRYLAELEEILPSELEQKNSDDTNIDELKNVIVQMLRQIKDIRKQKSEEENAAEAAMARDDDGKEKRRADSNGHNAAEPKAPTKPEDLSDTFAEAFCGVIAERFNVLAEGVEQPDNEDFKIPFLLSDDFSVHFKDILVRHFMPDLSKRCKGIILRAETEAPDRKKDFFLEYFEGRQGRENMWNHWQSCWKEIAVYREKPPEPAPPKKKGLLGALKKEKARPKYFTKLYTLEEWKEEIKKINKINKRVNAIWAEISQDKGTYAPPEEAKDNEILMSLFARSATGIQAQISAILQIVTQSENIGRAFDAYQTNKNTDLALMAVSFKDADQFLGKKALLKELLKGHSARSFPLIARFLPGQVKAG